jgi:hypothetical protein
MVTSSRGRRPDGRKWLPPVYREPIKPRVRSLDPAKPALRLVTIGLLTLLSCLLGIGIAWVIVL